MDHPFSWGDIEKFGIVDVAPDRNRAIPACSGFYTILGLINSINQQRGMQNMGTAIQALRLPTEAEWEYAAKGGKKTKGCIFAGSNDIEKVAWYNRNTTDRQPVRQKAPNELGLYDMSGNVAEWCSDWWSESYYYISSPKNPQGPEEWEATGNKVCRGGNIICDPNMCTTTARGSHHYMTDQQLVGFRLVLPAKL